MRVAVCANEANVESLVSSRFARCEFYAIYDNGNVSFEKNQAKEEMSGAGAKAGKQLSNLKVNVVLVPEIGPKAFDALRVFGIESYRYENSDLTIKEVKTAFENNELKLVEGFTSQGKH